MTNTQTYLLGTAFWLSGIAAFAGFGIAMNRPTEAPPPPAPETQTLQLTAATLPAGGVQEEQHVVELPPIQIVGHATPEPLRFEPQTIPPQPISE